MWTPWRKKEPEVVDMLSEEKEIICRFANGEETFRSAAIAIYRKYIPTLGAYGTHPEQNFMSEVDNPVPDLALRAMYRKVLLDK